MGLISNTVDISASSFDAIVFFPASVVISTSSYPSSPETYGGFDIVLIYPDQGVLAHYTAQRQIINDVIQGCSTNSAVELELFPVGDSRVFSDGLNSTSWAGYWPGPVDTLYWKPIEKATNMSLEEFYKSFREPSDKCIETPINLWPTQGP